MKQILILTQIPFFIATRYKPSTVTILKYSDIFSKRSQAFLYQFCRRIDY